MLLDNAQPDKNRNFVEVSTDLVCVKSPLKFVCHPLKFVCHLTLLSLYCPAQVPAAPFERLIKLNILLMQQPTNHLSH